MTRSLTPSEARATFCLTEAELEDGDFFCLNGAGSLQVQVPKGGRADAFLTVKAPTLPNFLERVATTGTGSDVVWFIFSPVEDAAPAAPDTAWLLEKLSEAAADLGGPDAKIILAYLDRVKGLFNA